MKLEIREENTNEESKVVHFKNLHVGDFFRYQIPNSITVYCIKVDPFYADGKFTAVAMVDNVFWGYLALDDFAWVTPTPESGFTFKDQFLTYKDLDDMTPFKFIGGNDLYMKYNEKYYICLKSGSHAVTGFFYYIMDFELKTQVFIQDVTCTIGPTIKRSYDD